MGNLSSHGAKAIKVSREGRSSNSNNGQRKNLWFQWGDKTERTIRLVGDFRWQKAHWIGKSNFGRDVKLFEDAAFQGDNKLPNQIVCGAWDAATESISEDQHCIVCEIMKKADKIMKTSGKDFDESQKQMINDVIFKCKPKDNYYFLCIDRDDPYIAEGEKGFKIIQMPTTLLEAITNLDSKLTAADLNSDDHGIDIVIKKSSPASGKGKTEYSVTPVFEGVSIKVTPLTDEEKSWQRPDLSKLTGKPYDNDFLRECLTDDMQTILSSDEEAPF